MDDTKKPSKNELYQQSIEQPEAFWEKQALDYISWYSPWTKVLTGDFNHPDIEWFTGASLNACYNCVDRHLEKNADTIALIWEGNEPGLSCQLSYAMLHEEVCKFANVLKALGVQKGDKVCLYLAMIPEAAIAMLACARIGAIHTLVFAGFSAESLKNRILDADCSIVVTADEALRGEKRTALKANVDEALENCPAVNHVLVIRRTGTQIAWNKDKDRWYHEQMAMANAFCPCEPVESSHPLFILYTSGSTGKPKGIVHSTGNYLLYVAYSFKQVFAYEKQDIFWCTADLGWITGHSYLLYGPLANAATSLMFEGVPQYPNYARYWEIIDKYQVNIFYTAPTAIRALRKEGDAWLQSSSRKSLKLLGSVGEPINPDVWLWYFDKVGSKRCPIVDTWWQTETGGIVLSPIPRLSPLTPGSVSGPFYGIVADIVDEKGKPVKAMEKGRLIITKPWPGLMKTIYGNKERYMEGYFKAVPGAYLSGDAAYRDAAGSFWISGRIDDVINVSGHRISTGELENALLSHPSVSEAAVVAIPDDLTGESIYAFVCTKTDIIPDAVLRKALIEQVNRKIGHIAKPKTIQWASGLPKTRSGKIMRRILRKIASQDWEELGDISTLAEPAIVDTLIAERKQYAMKG